MLAQLEVSMIKGKRSKRPRSASPLALTIATSSSTTADLSGGAVGDGVISDVSPSNSGEFVAHSAAASDQEEEDMANCLILLAKGQGQGQRSSSPPAAEVYQCKTCSKSFSSFQALGGHRASHKRPVKPTTLEEKKPLMRESFQTTSERDDSTNLSLQISSRSSTSTVGSLQSKTRVHECSICGAEFGSGQALGGHMRRHRPIAAAVSGGHGGVLKKARNLLSLDLNLPAPEDDQQESKFPFATKEQVIVFAASPLIDCHY